MSQQVLWEKARKSNDIDTCLLKCAKSQQVLMFHALCPHPSCHPLPPGWLQWHPPWTPHYISYSLSNPLSTHSSEWSSQNENLLMWTSPMLHPVQPHLALLSSISPQSSTPAKYFPSIPWSFTLSCCGNTDSAWNTLPLTLYLASSFLSPFTSTLKSHFFRYFPNSWCKPRCLLESLLQSSTFLYYFEISAMAGSVSVSIHHCAFNIYTVRGTC